MNASDFFCVGVQENPSFECITFERENDTIPHTPKKILQNKVVTKKKTKECKHTINKKCTHGNTHRCAVY